MTLKMEGALRQCAEHSNFYVDVAESFTCTAEMNSLSLDVKTRLYRCC